MHSLESAPAQQGAEDTVAGRLVAVVGPSGAGKDTLIAGARAALAGEPWLRFARRAITRPAAGAGGEDHLPMNPEEFAAARDSGAFALWWAAHGRLYGIPRGIEAELAAGRVVVANLSRAVLEEAAARHRRLLVLEITAPAALLAARLAARGREEARDVAARLARAAAAVPPGLDVVRVLNEGAVERGVAAVVAALRQAARP
jgi:phosphonate metabolism protein PhnN/1,5-bisphosphokinase (PRPP-forming)